MKGLRSLLVFLFQMSEDLHAGRFGAGSFPLRAVNFKESQADGIQEAVRPVMGFHRLGPKQKAHSAY